MNGVLGGLVVALLGASLLFGGTASTAFAASGKPKGLTQVPAALVAALAKPLASEAVGNPAYAIADDGCATLAHQALRGCFGHTGPSFGVDGQRVGLTLGAWGREGKLRHVRLKRERDRSRPNRVAYRGNGLAEWWRVLPLGYEQGFTLKRAPAGRGRVVLQLRASAAPRLENGTLHWGRLNYGKLYVTDATGKVLPASLHAHGKSIELAFEDKGARYPVTVDPLVWVEQKVTASDGIGGDYFGFAVALSGDGRTALIGAPYAPYDAVNNIYGPGAVYIFTRSNGAWGQVAKLTGTANRQAFGYSVSLSDTGNAALVGIPDKTVGGNTAQGAADIFTRNNGAWSKTIELTAGSDGAASDQFGSSVALSGDGSTALVGAAFATVGTNVGQGAAYVFTADPQNGWTTATPTVKLTASQGAGGDWFGWSTALSRDGSTALVGADFGQGAAYVFTADPQNGWAVASPQHETVELSPIDATVYDGFGYSVALSSAGDTALVGAWTKTVGGNVRQGAAYLFTAGATGGWTSPVQAAKFTASDGVAKDRFGASVALSGDGRTALIGAVLAPYDAANNNGGSGVVYQFKRPSAGWADMTETTRFTASDGGAGDGLGKAVALSNDGSAALTGAYIAPYDMTNNVAGPGAAYFFTGSNLSATLSAPATAVPGGSLDSQYILTNNSTAASADIKVRLPLPASGASYASATTTAAQGSCSYDSTTKVATCDLGSVPGGGSMVSATLSLTVTGAVGDTIAQSASLSSTTVGTLPVSQATTSVVLAPSISGTSDVSVAAGQAGSSTFTLAGTGSLTVSATSSNQSLLPDANISGASNCTGVGDCTLTLTPVAGQSGTATVTVTVKDGYGRSATASFNFTVAAASGGNTGSASGSVSGSGGGGALGPWSLLLVAILASVRRRRRVGV